MINFTAKDWENLDSLDSDEMLKEIKPQAEAVMVTALLRYETIIKETLSGGRSGRTYKVSKTGVLHVASAPGEPPAVLMGALRNSVGHSQPVWDTWVLSGEVGPGLGQPPEAGQPDPAKSYARRLELGGVDSRGVMIEPRPYMAPSADKAEPQVDLIFRNAMEST